MIGRLGVRLASTVAIIGASMVGVAIPPASAKTDLAVDAGYRGFFYPGRPTPVRVTVKADHLLRATVEMRLRNGGPGDVVVTRPVEVAGGSAKQVELVASQTMFGNTNADIEVTVREGNESVAHATASVSWIADQELVGVLPEAWAQAQPPDTTRLRVDAGTARFAPVLPADLSEPGALGPLDVLVAADGELGGLAPGDRRTVLGWVHDGGRLIVTAPRGAAVAGLPDGWQPGPSGRSQAGMGEIVTVDAQSASWWDRLDPTPTRSSAEDGALNQKNFGGFPLSATIARDAGLHTARLGWLIGFLVAYVLLVGPIAFLVLKRLGRPLLLWLVVPALAIVFTGAGWGAGRSLRKDASSAHSTVVEQSPIGAKATTWLGSVANGGGTVDLALPVGWMSHAQSQFNGSIVNQRQSITAKGPVAGITLAPGEFGVIGVEGPVDLQGGLDVRAQSSRDGQVDGTVTNSTSYALDNVAVFAGSGTAAVGALAPGEQKTFTVTGASQVPLGLPMGVWSEFSGFNGAPQLDGSVSVGAWTDATAQYGTNWTDEATVRAAGWTKAFLLPLSLRGSTVTGRTAIVGEAHVSASGALNDRSISRALVRTVGFGQDGPPANGELSATYAFTLPDAAKADAPLWVRVPSTVNRLSVWTNDAWTPLTIDAGKGVPPVAAPPIDFPNGGGFVVGANGGGFAVATTAVVVPATIVGGNGSASPGDTGTLGLAAVPASAIVEGRIYVKVTSANNPVPGLSDVYVTGTHP